MSEGGQIVTIPGETEDEGDWSPNVGPEAIAVTTRSLDDEETRQSVLRSSREILAKCAPPSSTEFSNTGLVLGYVQSGKTLSFTTVAALAKDNGYRIVIVIAGMTNDLAKQSYKRLLRDLGIEETPFNQWAEFFEPSIEQVPRIRDVLEEARDPNTQDDDRRTVLITVKKNHAKLRHLINTIIEMEDLVDTPTLIIDDEADQASMNTLVRDGELSTTYLRLRELKDLFPCHSFLQYTATPQAPLLINLIDVLSPSFTVVLEPGSDYVGASMFFQPGSRYVEVIPPWEVPTTERPLEGPPDSLLYALKLFFIGVASGRIRRDNRPRNRSMMVHPSRETVGHLQYHTWVQSIRTLWLDTLSLSDSDPEKIELLGQFQEAHVDLASTSDSLEEFEEISRILSQAIRTTDVRLVNSLDQADRDIHWNRIYSWILVGGQVLDRGFTVEGLTVTYMPRGPGVGNADTIQQRARFLGYKASYLGYCRVFLEDAVVIAYQNYIQHEEDVRRRLVRHIEIGRPLSDFRRVFLLDSELRPTRQSVIDIDYARPSFPGGWCVQYSPHDTDLDINRMCVDSFLESLSSKFSEDEGHQDRRDHQRHLIVDGVSLRSAYEEVLVPLHVRDFEDSQRWTALLLLLERYLNSDEGATCAVYSMRPNVETRRQVRDGRISNLFQGAYPDAGGAVYPGDRHIHVPPVSIQFHRLTLRAGPRADSELVADDVSCVVVWLSNEILADVVIQPQGG